jgi:hypothetical protein
VDDDRDADDPPDPRRGNPENATIGRFTTAAIVTITQVVTRRSVPALTTAFHDACRTAAVRTRRNEVVDMGRVS